jgi:hypothetical protein
MLRILHCLRDGKFRDIAPRFSETCHLIPRRDSISRPVGLRLRSCFAKKFSFFCTERSFPVDGIPEVKNFDAGKNFSHKKRTRELLAWNLWHGEANFRWSTIAGWRTVYTKHEFCVARREFVSCHQRKVCNQCKQGSILWSLFSAIFANFLRKMGVFLKNQSFDLFFKN